MRFLASATARSGSPTVSHLEVVVETVQNQPQRNSVTRHLRRDARMHVEEAIKRSYTG